MNCASLQKTYILIFHYNKKSCTKKYNFELAITKFFPTPIHPCNDTNFLPKSLLVKVGAHSTVGPNTLRLWRKISRGGSWVGVILLVNNNLTRSDSQSSSWLKSGKSNSWVRSMAVCSCPQPNCDPILMDSQWGSIVNVMWYQVMAAESQNGSPHMNWWAGD